MAHQNVFRTREGGGAKPLVTLSPQTIIVSLYVSDLPNVTISTRTFLLYNKIWKSRNVLNTK